MIARTYFCSNNGSIKRLDDLVGVSTVSVNPNLVDISLALGGIASGSTFTLYDIETDPTNGDKVIAVGDSNQGINPLYYGLALSLNKGVTWTIPGGTYGTAISGLGVIPVFTEVTWVDTNTVYACEQTGYIIKSIDGGLTFDLVVGSLPPSMTEAWSIHFATPTHGVVGGRDRIAFTNDGGNTWSLLNGGFTFSQTGTPADKIVGVLLLPNLTSVSALGELAPVVSIDSGATFTSPFTLSGTGRHLTWLTDGNGATVATTSDGTRYTGTGGFTLPGLITDNGGGLGGYDLLAAHIYESFKGFIGGTDIAGSQIYHSINLFSANILQDITLDNIQATWTWIDTNPPDPDYCGCPDGYSYNPISGDCETSSLTPATNSNPIALTSTVTGSAYNTIWGAVLYPDITSASFPITASSTTGIPTSPPGSGVFPYFSYPQLRDALLTPLVSTGSIAPTSGNITWGWDNTGPIPLNPGRLNQAGVWPAGLPTNEWWGMDICQNIPTTKTYLIGIAADDAYKLSINGQLLIDSSAGPFGFFSWALFPITLNAGNNIFKVEGLDTGLNYGLAFEIYDATFPQLQAVASPAALTPYILFSTANLAGKIVTSGTTTGYVCNPGCTINFCGVVEPECNCTDSVPYNPCCYLLTDCSGATSSILTNTDLSTYIGSYITLQGSGVCYLVSEAPGCQGSIPVTITGASYTTCEECTPECYLLVDCGTQETIKVSDDYSAYLGKIVNLANSGIRCWEVFSAPDCDGAIDSGTTVTVVYDSCAECVPFIPPIPVDLHLRRIKPGYYTAGCSPEYTEKVNCKFAEQVYNTMLSKRYGITVCCEEDLQKWAIKKALLDFRALYDPELCKSTLSICCPPCGVTAEILVFNPTLVCEPPYDVTADIIIPPDDCPAPENLSSGLILNPTIQNCVCYRIDVTNPAAMCNFEYVDCDSIIQNIVLPFGTHYLCSEATPTTLCSPFDYTIATTLGDCSLGTCG